MDEIKRLSAVPQSLQRPARNHDICSDAGSYVIGEVEATEDDDWDL